jgi:hypothetical protein
MRKEGEMAKQKVLVPFNFTPNDQKTIDFVINMFGPHKDAEITLYHGYIPVPEIDMKNAPIMQKMSQNLLYLRQKISESETEIKNAMDKLLKNGFSKDRVRYLFQPAQKDIAHEIVELVRSEGFDTIVLNRTSGKMTRFFTGNVFTKVVISVSNVIVLIVT